MYNGKFVFSQLSDFLDRNDFNYLARKYGGDKYVKQFTRERYPEKIRRVRYWDGENEREFIFFTNAININPMIVARPYHQRWQIELFFKWLKQHLKIKKIPGELRKRCQDTDPLRYHLLLYDGNCAEKDAY